MMTDQPHRRVLRHDEHSHWRCILATERPSETGGALATIRDADAWWAAKSCLLFMAFTGARSADARGATWDEIDLEGGVWTIPAERTKVGEEHTIQLPNQAIEVLRHAQEVTGEEGLVFPAERGGSYIQSKSLSDLMKGLEIPAAPHGLRDSFRHWADEDNHDSVEARATTLHRWADYLCETMGPVVPPQPDTT